MGGLFFFYVYVLKKFTLNERIFVSVSAVGIIFALINYFSDSKFGWLISVAYVISVTFWDTKDEKLKSYLQFLSFIQTLLSVGICYLHGDGLETMMAVGSLLFFIQYYTTEIIRTYQGLFLELEKANESKDDFLSMISHEIRTPVTSILHIADMLENRYKDQDVTTLHDCTLILLKLLNNTLDWQKWVAGKMDLTIEQVDLNRVLQNIVQIMKSKATSRNIVFNLSMDKIPLVESDSSKIERLLINLIGNAIKFTEVGSVSAKMIKVWENEQTIMVNCEITDTGIGMTEEESKRIFNPYVQATDKISRKYGGTGLGLAICRQIVDVLDGQISVQSAKNKGTTMTWSIPFCKVKQDVPKLEVKKEVKLDIPEGTLIHYCEDNLVIQTIIKKMLQSIGFHVTVSSNGKEMIEFLEQNSCKLLLIDKNMPIMDGITAAKFLRERYGNSIKMILLTADSTVPKGESEYFDACLIKPTSKDTLVATIRQFID